MAFEIELLNERFDVQEDNVWHVISRYWHVTQQEPYLSAFALSNLDIIDIRRMTHWHGDYDGIGLDIHFSKDGDKLIWLGVTYIGTSSISSHEHLLGYIEVRRARISFNTPVDVRVVCSWKPFYLFFEGLAQTLLSAFKQRPIDEVLTELLDFKSFVERQAYKDFYVRGRAQENIGRVLLQAFLTRRSYREIPVRGGQSDILAFDKEGRFLYEMKIWKGYEYFAQGLREIEEYIIGEDSDEQLAGVFYVLFDPTKSAAAHRYRGSDLTSEIIANRTVHVVIVSISPPLPSKKPK